MSLVSDYSGSCSFDETLTNRRTNRHMTTVMNNTDMSTLNTAVKSHCGLDCSMLEKLVQENINSAEGYHAALKDISDESYKTLFAEIASERKENSRTLKQVISSMGLEFDLPEDSTINATMKHWWTSIRSTMANDELHAVFAELEREEDKVLALYREAVEEVSHAALLTVLNEQCVTARKRHDRIRDIRDSLKSH